MKNSIRRILVPLDPSSFAAAATATACRIAKKQGAGVSGVAVLDSTEIRSSIVPAIGPYYPMMADAVQAKLAHADEVLRECLANFKTACDEAGVEHVESEYEGIPAQKLLASSIFYDLVVAGLETAFHFETRAGDREGIDRILDRTITPILAVPEAGFDEPKRVLITFDGSPASARALHDFVSFATPYDVEVSVLVADMDPTESDFLLSNAAAFLAAHGIDRVESVATRDPIEEASDKLLAEGFDLAVAGIHSKRIVKDLFVGSFTRSLIRRGDTALFLAR